MDTFNSAVRPNRRETDGRADHLDIFREFLEHLGRGSYRRPDEAKPGDRRTAK
jgi:hypothetical protein